LVFFKVLGAGRIFGELSVVGSVCSNEPREKLSWVGPAYKIIGFGQF